MRNGRPRHRLCHPLPFVQISFIASIDSRTRLEKAEYHGEFVNFDPMIARLKPVQKPHPPIHVVSPQRTG
jgi:alkanesulfonate monooxygenase SsuD/methylene tetrahydromethanopterin reductase-like flavin-dependent oxidoreductase (luciferase family)